MLVWWGYFVTNFGKIGIKIRFPYKKKNLKMSSLKCPPFCVGTNVLTLYYMGRAWNASFSLPISLFTCWRNHRSFTTLLTHVILIPFNDDPGEKRWIEHGRTIIPPFVDPEDQFPFNAAVDEQGWYTYRDTFDNCNRLVTYLILICRLWSASMVIRIVTLLNKQTWYRLKDATHVTLTFTDWDQSPQIDVYCI